MEGPDSKKIAAGDESELGKLFALAVANSACLPAEAEREAVMRALVDALDTPTGEWRVLSKSCPKNGTKKGRAKSLECLRVLLRETDNARVIYTRSAIEAVAKATQIASAQYRSLDGVKAMVNFAIRALEMERGSGASSEVLAVVREAVWGPVALQWLQDAVKRGRDSDETFALGRLLNMLLWDKEIVEQVSNQAIVDLLLDLLVTSVAHLEGKPDPDLAADARRYNIAGDTMRMFFQLTMDFGPLASRNAAAYPMTSEAQKQEEKQRQEKPIPPHIADLFARSLEPLQRALLFDYRDVRKSQLQLACITYAINMPKEQILRFDAYKTLPHLMDILHHHLEHKDDAAAASLLMLFTKIARDESKTRAIFMMRMFPRWKEIFESDNSEGVRMPEQHQGTTGKLIIDGMQSSSTGLQFYANEFVYLLCNESPGAFTRFVGFGPAAGHLAVRGLMNLGGGGGGGGGERPALEGAVATAASAADGNGARVTSWKEKKVENPQDSGMSPEDIKEWNDLCDKMDRLDQLGVIKMVRKDDEKK